MKSRIIDKRQWDLRIKFTRILANSFLRGTDGNFVIASSAIKGALRHAIFNEGLSREPSELFGCSDADVATGGLLHFGSLQLSGNEHRIEQRLWQSVDRFGGRAKDGSLHQTDVLENAVFAGPLVLHNGGVDTAVSAYELIRNAIQRMRVGRGESLGFGNVTDVWMERNVEVEREWLGEIDHIFWTAGDSIITHIARDSRHINNIEWRDLERIIAQIFAEIGYHVELTSSSHDGGKDVILFCASAKRKDCRFFIEVKHWRGRHKVGYGAVRKLADVIFRDGVNGGIFLSSSGFAKQIQNRQESVGQIVLGDLSTIHKLARYYVASRSGLGLSCSRLEELVSSKVKLEGI